MRSTIAAAILIAAPLSVCVQPAQAAGECPYLTRPLMESEGGTTRMNRWSNGTKVCHAGRAHVCMDGQWKLYESCSEQEPHWREHMAWRLEGGADPGAGGGASGEGGLASGSPVQRSGPSDSKSAGGANRKDINGSWCGIEDRNSTDTTWPKKDGMRGEVVGGQFTYFIDGKRYPVAGALTQRKVSAEQIRTLRKDTAWLEGDKLVVVIQDLGSWSEIVYERCQ